MNRICILCLVALFLVLQSLGAELAKPDLVRAFAEQKCSYTLPGPEWVWAEKPIDCIFVARNEAQQLAVILTVQPTWVDYFHPDFVKGIDRSALAGGAATKVSSREITFNGLPCYEAKMHLTKVNKTMISRYVLTHDSVYCLSAVYPDAAEGTLSNLDSMLGGFAFTTPPVPNKGPDRKPDYRKLGELLGSATVTLAIVALVLKFLYNAFLRKS